MKIEFLFIIIIIGFVASYLVDINYLKKLRNNEKNFAIWEVILANVFFGGPILLFFYIFDDFRHEDRLNKYVFLISGLALTAGQILLIVLLFRFKLIILIN
ncbi:MAG: hypothetical protein PHQ38_04860 [Bacilli bacterium]|nr:hypothetical protein [Bacilli bacterium]MDD3389211.1 hypothetical protein [Bacilli bacterium]